jgi:hypothetical protein
MKIPRIFKNGQKEKGIDYILLDRLINTLNIKSLSFIITRRTRLYSQNDYASLAAARTSLKSYIISKSGSRRLCYLISKKLNPKAIQ